MGDILNQVTQPFGVKLFPGGPYSDSGAGDKALAATDTAKQQALGMMTGQGEFGQDWQALLTPEESQMFNRQTDALSQAAQAAIAQVRASAASRGMPESYVQAMEQRIKDNLIGRQTDLRVQMYQMVEQKRQQMANIITGAGAQTAGAYQQIGAQKQAEQSNLQGGLAALLSPYLGKQMFSQGATPDLSGYAGGQGKTGSVGGEAANTAGKAAGMGGIGASPALFNQTTDPAEFYAAFVKALTGGSSTGKKG